MTDEQRGGAVDPTYPTPDRSEFTPNSPKTADNDVIDVGWAEGLLSDGRPFRLECWCQDQVMYFQIFFSRLGSDDLDRDGIQKLLERENLVNFVYSKRYASGQAWRDQAGNDLWSVNVVVGDEDELYVSGGPPLIPYTKPK